MKYFLTLLITMLFAMSVQAGSLTINTNSAQDQRIIKAFGKVLNTQTCTGDPEVCTPRNATGKEVKAAVIQYLKQTVYSVERNEARQNADKSVSELNPE